MGARVRWNKETCLAYLDSFIQSEQRHPCKEECNPKHGLPSDTAFRCYVGTGILSYCCEHYSEYGAEQTRRTVHSELDAACGLWCKTLAEHPERASGEGFSDFYRTLITQGELDEQQNPTAEPQMGGMKLE